MNAPIDRFGAIPADELRVLTERSIATLLKVLLICLNPAASSPATRASVPDDLQSVAADLQHAADRVSA